MSGLMSGVWKQGMEEASEAPATERAGNGWAFPALLRHTSTLHPSSCREPVSLLPSR